MLNNIKVINLPDYITEWDSSYIPKLLDKELGWEHPPEGTGRFDCLFYPFMLYYTTYKFNWNPIEMKLAAIVRSGSISKKEAKTRLISVNNMISPDILEGYLDRLSISKEEFDNIFYSLGHRNTILPKELP